MLELLKFTNIILPLNIRDKDTECCPKDVVNPVQWACLLNKAAGYTESANCEDCGLNYLQYQNFCELLQYGCYFNFYCR